MTNDSIYPTVTVSVIIPTYNRARTILRAVNSALRQTLPPLEVLVIDDGCSDNTSQIVMSHPDPRVKCIGLNGNHGAQYARLIGISYSCGSHVVFLDSDDELLPDSIEIRLQSLLRSPWPEALVFGDAIRKGKIDTFESLTGYVYPYLLKELSLCPYSVMLVPKRCFEVAGLPNPDFPSWQDDDMVLTIGKYFPVIHCGSPVAIMNEEANSISGNKSAVVEGGRMMVAKYSGEILETHGRFRLFCWRVRILRSMVDAKCNEARCRLQFCPNISNMLSLVLLTAVRISFTIMLKPFFRKFYG